MPRSTSFTFLSLPELNEKLSGYPNTKIVVSKTWLKNLAAIGIIFDDQVTEVLETSETPATEPTSKKSNPVVD